MTIRIGITLKIFEPRVEKTLKATRPFPSGFVRLEDTIEQAIFLVRSKRACQVLSTTNGGEVKLLSRDCDGCSQMKACNKRYGIVDKGDRVYCPDGTAHLVDGL